MHKSRAFYPRNITLIHPGLAEHLKERSVVRLPGYVKSLTTNLQCINIMSCTRLVQIPTEFIDSPRDQSECVVLVNSP